MAPQAHKAKSIFLDAAEITSEAERRAYIEAECSGDEDLRHEVESLLQHHSQLGRFLDPAALGSGATLDLPPITEKPGTLIGPYKLLEQIGEGGMGLVFMARQQEPVKRNVALKVIKPGMDSKQVIGRFEAERQALALMEHPNIARVLDAGSTESGRPYFVMDLVRGIPITEYCDRNRLSTRERLDLFISICHAVQHAHQRGIIHRDLKPTNVLVTSHDGTPVPKVIDFGIAKATTGQLTDETLVTNFAQMIGTPLYMSPEQAEMSGLDVDTRSDVYSLGVLLYELLTGTTPFERDKFSDVCFDELRRIIREDDPPRPSTRLSTLNAALDTVAAKRHTDSRTLRREVSGELDWIVMKALEKDRTRRYETANDLAKDVTRYLNDDPVEACPPSATYRFRKFARRHRTIFTASAAVIMALVLGAVIATGQAIRATKAEGLAEERLTVANKNERVARQQKEEAVQQRDTARQNLYFANIRMVQHDWKAGHIGRMYESLDSLLPQPGQADLRGWEWYYLLSLSYRDSKTLREHAGRVDSVAWSPDGKRLASGSRDGTFRVWDAATGQQLLSLHGHLGSLSIAAWSPDGKRLAGGADARTVIWDTTTGKEVLALQWHAGPVRVLAWSPDGKRLAVGTTGSALSPGVLELWDADTGKRLLTRRVDGDDKLVGSVAWSPDGTRLAYGTELGWLKVCDGTTGEEIRSWKAHSHALYSLAWSPDGRQIFSGSFNCCAKLWEVDTAEEIYTLPHTGGVMSVALSPDGKRLASGATTQNVILWDTATGEELTKLRGHLDTVWCVAWSPDGKRVASASRDSTVKIWDVPGIEKDLPAFKLPWARAVAWSPDGQYLAVGPKEQGDIMRHLAVGSKEQGDISICDPTTGEVVRTLPGGPNLAWSPDGNRLAARREDGTVTILDADTGKEHLTLDLGSNSQIELPVHGIDWTPDGKRLATTSGADYTALVFNTSTGEKTLSLAGHGGPVLALKWAPEDNRLASAAWDGTIKIWDGATGKELFTLHGHTPGSFIHSVAWSPDGRRLASGGADQILRVWDTSTGKQLFSLSGHSSPIRSVQWNPDGTRLVSTDGFTVRFWDASNGRELLEIEAERELVAWSPDGKRIALAGSEEGTLEILDASSGYEFVETPDYRLDRANMLRSTGRLREGREIIESLAKQFTHVKAYLDQRTRVELLELPGDFSDSDRVIADCTKLLQLDASCHEAYYRRGMAHLVKRNLDRAIDDLTQAIRFYPGPLAYRMRGIAYQNGGNLDLAIADYTEAIRLAPELSWCHNQLAWILATSADPSVRDPKRAVELAEQAVKLSPNDGNSWNTLGVARYRADKWEAAIEALNKSVELSGGGNAFDWFFLAMAHWKLDQKDEARQWYGKAVEWMEKNKPEDEELRRFRAEATELLGISGEKDE